MRRSSRPNANVDWRQMARERMVTSHGGTARDRRGDGMERSRRGRHPLPPRHGEDTLPRGTEKMLLDGFNIRLVNISCLPNSEALNAIVELRGDVGPALPYLNATVPCAHYSHRDQILDFMWDGHIVTVTPQQMKITGVADEVEARRLVQELRDLIERTWANRREVAPVYETRRPPSPVEVLRSLPRTNCGACGQPTCLALAVRIARGLSSLDECPELRAGGAIG